MNSHRGRINEPLDTDLFERAQRAADIRDVAESRPEAEALGKEMCGVRPFGQCGGKGSQPFVVQTGKQRWKCYVVASLGRWWTRAIGCTPLGPRPWRTPCGGVASRPRPPNANGVRAGARRGEGGGGPTPGRPSWRRGPGVRRSGGREPGPDRSGASRPVRAGAGEAGPASVSPRCDWWGTAVRGVPAGHGGDGDGAGDGGRRARAAGGDWGRRLDLSPRRAGQGERDPAKKMRGPQGLIIDGAPVPGCGG